MQPPETHARVSEGDWLRGQDLSVQEVHDLNREGAAPVSRRIEYRWCHEGGQRKRRFATGRDAEKALGRARTSRLRRADALGTRRGLEWEKRFFACRRGDGYQLQSPSSDDYQAHT